MGAGVRRYIVENHGPVPAAVEFAFREAARICRDGRVSELHLLVPHKGHFPNTVAAGFLDRRTVKALCAGKKVYADDDLFLTLSSPQTLDEDAQDKVILALHIGGNQLDTLDSTLGARAIIFLPWHEDDGKAWKQTWKPTTLGAETWPVATNALHPAVEDALLRITDAINLSTGITHPSDKTMAQETFKELKRAGHRPDLEHVKQWALRHNWAPEDANNLKKVAERYSR